MLRNPSQRRTLMLNTAAASARALAADETRRGRGVEIQTQTPKKVKETARKLGLLFHGSLGRADSEKSTAGAAANGRMDGATSLAAARHGKE